MRDVRRRERIAGTRRPSKKERVAQVSRALSATEASPIASPRRQTRPSVDESLKTEDDVTNVIPSVKQEPGHSLRSQSLADLPHYNPAWSNIQDHFHSMARRHSLGLPEQRTSPLIQATPGPTFHDPFEIPEGEGDEEGTSKIVETLMKYLVDVFIPETFPSERKAPGEIEARVNRLMQHRKSDPATFYATMAMCAAHRAMKQGRNLELSSLNENTCQTPEDPDFLLLHHKAITDINRKMADSGQRMHPDTFQNVMMVVGATMSVGRFAEARFHLRAFLTMVETNGGFELQETDSTSIYWNVFIADVKAAVGLQSRPQLPLPKRYDDLDEALRQRINPDPWSGLHRFATKFRSTGVLSQRITGLLESIQDLAFLDNFQEHHDASLSPLDHDILRRRALTIEHSLVEYAWTEFGSSPDSSIPFLEAVTRLSALAYFSSRFIVAQPNSGLGRSLTFQMYQLLRSISGHQYGTYSVPVLELLIWSACMSIQGARGQNEESFFYSHLRHWLILRQWREWSDFQHAMEGFLYEPRIHEASWKLMFYSARRGLSGVPSMS